MSVKFVFLLAIVFAIVFVFAFVFVFVFAFVTLRGWGVRVGEWAGWWR